MRNNLIRLGLFVAVATFALGQVPSENNRVPVDKTITLTVTNDGTPPFVYQWRKNDVDIPGANSVDLAFPKFGEADAGIYSVKVSNEAGFTISNKVQLVPVKAPSKSTITVNIAIGAVNP